MNRVIVTSKNEVGVIADITAPLAAAGVNILTINTESTDETGMVILTTDNNDAALEALTAAGHRAVLDETLLIRLQDEPGALASIAVRFKSAGQNIQSVHIVDRREGFTIIALSVDDQDKARELLGDLVV